MDWRAFDAAELLDAVSRPLSGGQREALLAVDGVHCQGCVRGVERALAGAAGDVRVDLPSRTVEFAFDPARTPLSQLLERLERAGYRPQVLAQDGALEAERHARRVALARVGVAALCAMQVMMLAWPAYSNPGEIDPGIAQLLRWSQWLLATPAVFYGGWPFIAGAARSLRAGAAGMDVPVAGSILVAYGASAWRTAAGAGDLYFDAATMFVMLLGAGRYLEGQARALAGDRLRRLAGRRPLTALRVADDGATHSVPLAAVQEGERVRVAPGEALPVDGVLLEAEADLDESLLTGEALAARRHPGDAVLAGAINAGARFLDLRATGVGAATWLDAVTRLQRNAGRDKPAAQLLAERIAGKFVGAVLLVALAGAAAWWPHDPERALAVLLAVLVVSCPCALSLAMPAVFAAAGSRLAAAGVLLLRPSALAQVARVTHAVFDKTGTLTEPDLRLEEVRVLGEVPEAQCRAIAAALERGLRHPVARALSPGSLKAPAADGVRLAPGPGLTGTVAGEEYWLGAPEHLDDPAVAQCLATGGPPRTWILLARARRPLALFGLAARPQAGVVDAIRALKADGIRVRLLSGDSREAVCHLAGELGIEHPAWRQAPEQKLGTVRELQRHGAVVLAVGDGINDAPLLAGADVGVAMPDGAALAQARADLILTRGSPAALEAVRAVAAQARRRIRENIAWAVGYNLVMLPMALSGALTPWQAALGMSLSSLIVVGNALRVNPTAAAPRAAAAVLAPAH